MVKSLSRHRSTIAVLLLTAGLSLAAGAQDERLDLPDMGASADAILSRQEEKEYAEALVRQMRAYEVLNEDPLITGFFENMGYRLVSNSDRPDKPFTFVVINQPIVNAFAAPGGVVALYSGLILEADDENEVAGVLAHEVAHITQQHLYRAIENQKAMTIPILLAAVGLVLAGGGSGEAIQAGVMGAQAAATQAQIYFTRQNEIEADRIGILNLHASGFDPRGMSEFFQKMGRLNRAAGAGPPEYLRTHPVSVTRIAEAEGRIQNMSSPEPSDGKDFYIVQARLRAVIAEHPDATLEFFESRMERADVSEAELDAIQYGMAISLQRKGEFDEARRILNSLLLHDQHLAYQLQIAELELESGNQELALQQLADLHNGFPGNHVIALQYGRALLKDRDPERAAEASQLLRQQLRTHDQDPVLYELYARSANIAGKEVRAQEAIAESYFLRGGIHEAALQLEKLLKRDDLDYYQRARVSSRLREFRAELARLGLDESPPE